MRGEDGSRRTPSSPLGNAALRSWEFPDRRFIAIARSKYAKINVQQGWRYRIAGAAAYLSGREAHLRLPAHHSAAESRKAFYRNSRTQEPSGKRLVGQRRLATVAPTLGISAVLARAASVFVVGCADASAQPNRVAAQAPGKASGSYTQKYCPPSPSREDYFFLNIWNSGAHALVSQISAHATLIIALASEDPGPVASDYR